MCRAVVTVTHYEAKNFLRVDCGFYIETESLFCTRGSD